MYRIRGHQQTRRASTVSTLSPVVIALSRCRTGRGLGRSRASVDTRSLLAVQRCTVFTVVSRHADQHRSHTVRGSSRGRGARMTGDWALWGSFRRHQMIASRPKMYRIRSHQKIRKNSTSPTHFPEVIARSRCETDWGLDTMGRFRRCEVIAWRPWICRIRSHPQTRKDQHRSHIVQGHCTIEMQTDRGLGSMGELPSAPDDRLSAKDVLSSQSSADLIHRVYSYKKIKIENSASPTHRPGVIARSRCEAGRRLETMRSSRRHELIA